MTSTASTASQPRLRVRLHYGYRHKPLWRFPSVFQARDGVSVSGVLDCPDLIPSDLTFPYGDLQQDD